MKLLSSKHSKFWDKNWKIMPRILQKGVLKYYPKIDDTDEKVQTICEVSNAMLYIHPNVVNQFKHFEYKVKSITLYNVSEYYEIAKKIFGKYLPGIVKM